MRPGDRVVVAGLRTGVGRYLGQLGTLCGHVYARPWFVRPRVWVRLDSGRLRSFLTADLILKTGAPESECELAGLESPGYEVKAGGR